MTAILHQCQCSKTTMFFVNIKNFANTAIILLHSGQFLINKIKPCVQWVPKSILNVYLLTLFWNVVFNTGRNACLTHECTRTQTKNTTLHSILKPFVSFIIPTILGQPASRGILLRGVKCRYDVGWVSRRFDNFLFYWLNAKRLYGKKEIIKS